MNEDHESSLSKFLSLSWPHHFFQEIWTTETDTSNKMDELKYRNTIKNIYPRAFNTTLNNTLLFELNDKADEKCCLVWKKK